MIASPVDRVVDRLEAKGLGVKRNGVGYTSRCPAHDDSNPSLTVAAGADGRALVKCQAGCQFVDVVAALDLTPAELFDEPNGNGHHDKPKIVATYHYDDAAGLPVFRVNRWEPGFDGERKTFRPQHPDGRGGWATGFGDAPRPLYRLPDVLAAVAAGNPIFVVEGEKDADRIAREGFTATTNVMGAGKWRPEYTEQLRGADVIVVADLDGPGKKHAGERHATTVAAALEGVAASVRRASPAQGKDVSDHLDAGHSLEDLTAVDTWDIGADEPPDTDQAPSETPTDNTDISRLRAKLIRGVDAIRGIPSRRSLIAGVLDLDSFAVTYGRPGSAKSFVAIDIGLHVATGSWWHGHRVRQGPVLYIVAEGSGGIAARVNAWTIQNRYHGAGADFIVLPAAVNLLDVSAAATLAAIANEIQPALVIIDTLNRSMAGGDENTSRDMGLVIAAADAVRAATGACVNLVHHSGKDTAAGARGHSSLLGAVDTELEVKKADGIITFATTKQKDKPDGDTPTRFVLVPHTWTCTSCNGDTPDCDYCAGTRKVGSAAIAPYAGRVIDDISDDQKALDALEALASVDVPGGVPTTVWLEAATSDQTVGPSMVRSTFFTKRKTLLESGKVRQIGEGRNARYSIATSENDL